MRILVTGASGFAGSLLTRALCREGHAVRAFGRDPERIRRALAQDGSGAETGGGPEIHREPEIRGEPELGGGPETGGPEIFAGDALTGEGLHAALDGVDVAYYLIHSMEPAPGGESFAQRERRAADNFARLSAQAGVRRIVYLGGLVPRWEAAGPGPAGTSAGSRHLASREQVERTLLEAVPGSIALRASIVIGARSRSFRLLVRLVERMPVIALPSWRRFRTQPIDARDVTAMLVAAAAHDAPAGSLDIGGRDILTYGEMIERIAELMLLGRPSLRLGVTMRGVSGRVAAAIAGEDFELVGALMEGLKGDLLPSSQDAPQLLKVRLHSFDAAVEHALADWERSERLAAR